MNLYAQYQELNDKLLHRIEDIVAQLFPNGHWSGNQFYAADIDDSKQGKSFAICRKTGLFYDFANPDIKGNLITLCAYRFGKTKVQLLEDEGLTMLNGSGQRRYINGSGRPMPPPPETEHEQDDVSFIPIPEGQDPPWDKMGRHDQAYLYRDKQGRPLCYVTLKRYEGGKKKFTSVSYSTQLNQEEFILWNKTKFSNSLYKTNWHLKRWPKPFPLYGLEELGKYPENDVLVVEGEQCVHAARKLLADTSYVIVSPMGGAGAVKHNDWEPLLSRSKVVIWPDNDSSGVKMREYLCELLVGTVSNVCHLNPEGQAHKWDCANALAEWRDKNQIKDFWNENLIHFASVFEKGEQKKKTPPPAAEDSKERKSAILKLWKLCGVDYNSNFFLANNMANVSRFLDGLPALKGAFIKETFSGNIYTRVIKKKNHEIELADKYRPITTEDKRSVVSYLQNHLNFLNLNKDIVSEGIKDFAELPENRRNLCHEHILDIVNRNKNNLLGSPEESLKTFMHDVFGTPLDEYSQRVSLSFWCSMMARIFQPAVKCDFSVVLEGKQGDKKSFVLELIGGDWYASPNAQYSTRDWHTQCQGAFIVESADGKNFEGVSENKRKGELTERKARITKKYEDDTTIIPKSYIIVITTNDGNEHFKDPTGNRRHYLIKVHKVADLVAFEAKLENYIMEAYMLYKSGYDWWTEPKELQEVQDRVVEKDIWEDKVREYIARNKLDEVTLAQLATHPDCLNQPIYTQNNKTSNRLRRILRRMDWEGYSTRRRGEKVTVYSYRGTRKEPTRRPKVRF